MVDIEKLKEICGDEALSETPSRYITTSEYREAFEAFVEEVSPAAVLELIAENERFKAERDQLRAEVEALRKDADRWRMARQILTVEAISDAHLEFVNFGLPADERENIRADSAIDAAMAAKEGE